MVLGLLLLIVLLATEWSKVFNISEPNDPAFDQDVSYCALCGVVIDG